MGVDDGNDGNGNEESVGVIWLPVKEGDGFAQIPTYYHADRQTSFDRNETAVIQSCPYAHPMYQ